jgi:hypothetical protein
MSVVIRLVARANGARSQRAGKYIARYVPSPFGRDILVVSTDVGRAKRFEDHTAAHAFWTQQHGMRADGLPNRPLTAWTVEILPAGDDE